MIQIGKIISLKDGIGLAQGLDEVAYGELVISENNLGIVLNLLENFLGIAFFSEDNLTVGSMVFKPEYANTNRNFISLFEFQNKQRFILLVLIFILSVKDLIYNKSKSESDDNSEFGDNTVGDNIYFKEMMLNHTSEVYLDYNQVTEMTYDENNELINFKFNDGLKTFYVTYEVLNQKINVKWVSNYNSSSSEDNITDEAFIIRIIDEQIDSIISVPCENREGLPSIQPQSVYVLSLDEYFNPKYVRYFGPNIVSGNFRDILIMEGARVDSILRDNYPGSNSGTNNGILVQVLNSIGYYDFFEFCPDGTLRESRDIQVNDNVSQINENADQINENVPFSNLSFISVISSLLLLSLFLLTSFENFGAYQMSVPELQNFYVTWFTDNVNNLQQEDPQKHSCWMLQYLIEFFWGDESGFFNDDLNNSFDEFNDKDLKKS